MRRNKQLMDLLENAKRNVNQRDSKNIPIHDNRTPTNTNRNVQVIKKECKNIYHTKKASGINNMCYQTEIVSEKHIDTNNNVSKCNKLTNTNIFDEEQKQFDQIYVTIREPKSWLCVDNVVKKTDNDINNNSVFSIPYCNRGVKCIGNNLYQFMIMYEIPKMITIYIDSNTMTYESDDIRRVNGYVVNVKHSIMDNYARGKICR